MSDGDLLKSLMEAFRCLPGVGPKTAQRMAFHILERDREGGRNLAETLAEAVKRIGHCERCRNLSEADLCGICRNASRDDALLCVVESPVDVDAIEQATGYRGRYFVLMGRLSPLDGIGPESLGLDDLAARIQQSPPEELIIATSSTVEGEATAFYLQRLAQKHDVSASRLAHGVPLGGELEFTDQSTLAMAFGSRRPVDA